MQLQIQQKIEHALNPEYLTVIDESHMHNVPAGAESHFKVTVVSEQFNGKRLVARHQWINQILAEELAGKIHALALHTLTPDEYRAKATGIKKSSTFENIEITEKLPSFWLED
jgi:BolA protein